jgi:hypothetical protein
MPNEFDRDFVRKEILTYCAALPAGIMARGQDELANVALTLGNCLVWIAPQLDGPGPQIEENLSQVPQSIFSLGRHLQWVGRDWWNPPNRQVDRGTQIAKLQAEVARLDKLVHRLAAKTRAK